MHKTFKFLLCAILFITSQSMANPNCFVAKENSTLIKREGRCAQRHTPCSTFKLAISLMGYNEGILTDVTHPEWPYRVGYDAWKASWKQPHNPTTWIKDSCVWYSQKITQTLGMAKFKKYVNEFHYGNQDVSGDIGKDNGLTHAWLSSSLQISADEQVDFLQRLLKNKLPVDKKTQNLTRAIFYVEDLPHGWKLYGKTGSGLQQNSDRSLNPKLQVGWFVGWVEKGARKIVFANYIVAPRSEDLSGGQQAKSDAIKELNDLL
jgi:beta-lactamase class D